MGIVAISIQFILADKKLSGPIFKVRPLNSLATVYTDFFRNTPSNFEIWEDYQDTINASDYFIDSYENVSFPSTDDVTISGWWMEQNPGGPTVIINHGLTSSKYSSGILLASGILYRNGFNVLAIDLRDHGDSTCEDGYYSAGQKESYDSAAAVSWLVDTKGIPPNLNDLI